MGTIISKPNAEIDVLFAESPTTNSNAIIQLINVNVSDALTDEYIEITFNGVTITLTIEDDYKHTPVDVYFINKEGQQQCLTFLKEKTESISITKEQYESNYGEAKDGFHQFKNFNVQGRTSFKANSGFVDEAVNQDFKQLLLAESVWTYTGGDLIPINVEQTALEYKTRLKNRLINYEIQFKYSYNEIN